MDVKTSNAGENINKSGLVSSKQNGVHPGLDTNVRKHLDTKWRQPMHAPTVDLFRQLEQHEAFSTRQPLILDSGCGTGKSTRWLAERYPHHLVIGADRSLSRLARSGYTSGLHYSENWMLMRAELTTFWQLLLNAGISPEKHFLFYPNPWPKPAHLSRRWHGHPVFPQLLSLGGEIELRCNWRIYAEEFARAAMVATRENIKVQTIKPSTGVSPFEQKYIERGQQLFSVVIPAGFSHTFRQQRLNQ